jgi:hypothetical protein
MCASSGTLRGGKAAKEVKRRASEFVRHERTRVRACERVSERCRACAPVYTCRNTTQTTHTRLGEGVGNIVEGNLKIDPKGLEICGPRRYPACQLCVCVCVLL